MMHIIYVDDERSAHINFEYYIKNRQDISKVAYFYECTSPVDYVKENMVDCAFLDVEFPGESGINLGKQLKEIQPNLELVFVSSHLECEEEIYELGACAYLPKPYDQIELDEVIIKVEKRIVTESNWGG